ncbi:LuxR C-terminal-related transcriptional regulator [Halanaerobium sp. DL-01]|uniref:LuxR C-terminal-related transcriptional regulator n=1 Tax=Halanaerobium sp. DL-01 TaxID=1653064 RepID=UPI000DF2DB04|nr:LuxR C-terminal-related transcriptional regulator [Halanaerobium sp. DL-01]
MQSLSKKELEKIYMFILKTGQTINYEKYPYLFLKEIEKIIPYYAANFFLFDEKENPVCDPICINIKKDTVNMYEKYYYKLDTIRAKAFNQPDPIRSTDLLNYSQWVNTEYFTDFISPNNFYFSCGIDIIYRNQLLGAVSLFREKTDKNFSLKDLLVLEFISNQAANQLFKLSAINKLNKTAQRKKEQLIALSEKRYNLTARESEVLNLLISGKNNREIAAELYISINTVKKHLSHIYMKANVDNRTELTSAVFKCEKYIF